MGLAFNVNIQYASQMGFIFKPYPNQRVSETNKASEDGTVANVYVNKGSSAQTRREEHPLGHPFPACALRQQVTKPTFGVNTLSSV